MLLSFVPVFLIAILGTLFVFGNMIAVFLLSPKVPDPDKGAIYDCGEYPIGDAWVNANIRFYIIALVFLIFEVEVAVMYPVAAVFKSWAAGPEALTALASVLLFAGVLFIGVIYAWTKGDFEWISYVQKTRMVGPDSNALPVNLRADYVRKRNPA